MVTDMAATATVTAMVAAIVTTMITAAIPAVVAESKGNHRPAITIIRIAVIWVTVRIIVRGPVIITVVRVSARRIGNDIGRRRGGLGVCTWSRSIGWLWCRGRGVGNCLLVGCRGGGRCLLSRDLRIRLCGDSIPLIQHHSNHAVGHPLVFQIHDGVRGQIIHGAAILDIINDNGLADLGPDKFEHFIHSVR